MTSILTAINKLAQKVDNSIASVTTSRTTANAMGDSLQAYIEKLFINNAENLTPEQINEQKEIIFSWSGSQNRIPDLIIRNGDAIEIKKIEGVGSLALNSSHPKQFLSSESPMIATKCKNCEGVGVSWEKELWYIVGTVKDNKINYLFFLQGLLYAAEESVYDGIKKIVRTGVTGIEDVQLSETKELGRVNEVDPLRITSLRIRGMWEIEHPFNVYSYISELEKSNDANKLLAYALISEDKYSTFNIDERQTLENNPKIQILDKKIKNPDNPIELIKAKFIKFEV